MRVEVRGATTGTQVLPGGTCHVCVVVGSGCAVYRWVLFCPCSKNTTS